MKIFDQRVNDPGPLGLTDMLPGDALGNFNTPLRGKNTPENGGRNDERLYAFEDDEFNFTVPFEGVYVDDLIVGFAAFGEQGANLRPDYIHEPTQGFETIPDVFEGEKGVYVPIFPPPAGEILRASTRSRSSSRRLRRRVTPSAPSILRDRLSQSISIVTPLPADIYDGQSFFISDGVATLTFEFDDADASDGVADGSIPFAFSAVETRQVVMERVRDAVNALFIAQELDVTAAGSNGAAVGTVGSSERLNLFGTVVTVTGDIEVLLFDDVGRKIENVTKAKSLSRATPSRTRLCSVLWWKTRCVISRAMRPIRGSNTTRLLPSVL